jgi:molybdopterin converting factor small subunit
MSVMVKIPTQRLETGVEDGDEVTILPAVAGGA